MSVVNYTMKGITPRTDRKNPWEYLMEGANNLQTNLNDLGKSLATYGKYQELSDIRDAIESAKTERDNELRRRQMLDNSITSLQNHKKDFEANLDRIHNYNTMEGGTERGKKYYYNTGKEYKEFIPGQTKDVKNLYTMDENGKYVNNGASANYDFNADKASDTPTQHKTMLGYLDDYNRKNVGAKNALQEATAEPTFDEQEILDELLKERESLGAYDDQGYNDKIMDYAVRLKGLGDSSLYDELVSKRNYEQTERNNKASSEDKGLSNDDATKMYDEAMTNIDILSTKKGLDVNVAAEGLKDANNAYKTLLRANTPYSLQLAKELKVKIDGIESTASGNEEAAKQTRQNKANKAAQQQKALNESAGAAYSKARPGSAPSVGSTVRVKGVRLEFDGINWNPAKDE